MDIETRVTNLENMLASIVNTLSNNKFYTDADIAGVRQSVSDVTPYTKTKTAYIDDTEIEFKDVPNGTYNVSFNKSVYATRVSKEDFTDGTSTVTIEFAPLEEVTEVTLTIN
jgi:hypothetical protein